MSGYRIIHRHSEGPVLTSTVIQREIIDENKNENENASENECPVFAVQFSPCNQTHHTQRGSSGSSSASAAGAGSKPPTRLLTSSADGFIRCYSITDKSAKADVLDASALSMKLEQVLLLSSDDDSCPCPYPKSKEASMLSLGSATLSVVRNYLGEDTKAGGEIAAALRLDGHVSLWKRDEQPVYPNHDNAVKDVDINIDEGKSKPIVIKPDVEFQVKTCTGTTMTLLPPQLTGFSRHGIVMMVGMLDGAISFRSTGIGIPNSMKGNDESKFTEPGEILDNVGAGNSIPLSLAVHPLHHLTFAVGRKDGSIDVYSSGTGNDCFNDDVYGQFRRRHRFSQHAGSPVRAIAYTPDGSLLISGCDEGHIYIHDMSSFHQNETIRMVAAIHNAHKGYILSVAVLPDAKRFVTSSADRTLKVWNVGTPNAGPVHTFDTGNSSMVWDVSCSTDGHRCVSSSDDGCVQIYSCEE